MADSNTVSAYCIVDDCEEETMEWIIAMLDAEWSCSKCKHVNRKDLSCAAFPNGIPDAIFMREFDHRKPYPSAKNPEDNGIRFEAIEERN